MVEFRHDSAFEQSRCAVRSLSRGGKGVVVSMAQPCWRLGLAVGQMGLPSVVENIGDVGSGSRLAPGQWHHRRAPLTLRYRPRSAAERAELLGGDSDAAVPLAAELLVADGVSRLSVQGITFMHSSWDAPRSDDGYLERYGGVRFLSCTSAAAEETRRCYRNGSACAAGCCGAAALGGCALRMAEAAVSIRSGTDVEVSGCEFRQVGAWGLALTAGPLRVRAERNTFTDCSGGGIYVGNVNETATEGTTRRPTGVAVAECRGVGRARISGQLWHPSLLGSGLDDLAQPAGPHTLHRDHIRLARAAERLLQPKQFLDRERHIRPVVLGQRRWSCTHSLHLHGLPSSRQPLP